MLNWPNLPEIASRRLAIPTPRPAGDFSPEKSPTQRVEVSAPAGRPVPRASEVGEAEGRVAGNG